MTLDQYIRDTYRDANVIYSDPDMLRGATEEYLQWAARQPMPALPKQFVPWESTGTNLT